MKKVLSIASILLFAFLVIGCSSDDSNPEADAFFQKIQGKWKLTDFWGDTPEQFVTIEDGYEMEFKADKTFTSTEVPGYTGGKYSVITKPGHNIKLVFKNSSGSKILYKYINYIEESGLSAQFAQDEPLSDEFVFFAGEGFARIP